jgi:hypothetical protein
MSTIQKAAFAASALAITLAGALSVTAPMTFARPQPAMTRSACSVSSVQLALSGHVSCVAASRDAGLLADVPR